MIHLNDAHYPYLEEINVGVLKHVPRHHEGTPKAVLDVGCGQGTLGAEIHARGYEVWGIDGSSEAVRKAQERLSRVILEDITEFEEVSKKIGSERFDLIVFSDVLEHVYDPLTVLKRYLEFLKPGGQVIVSVPNVLVWTNRLAMFFGRFDYEDTGVMDRTHMRFFTFKTTKALLQAAGCQIRKVDYTPFMVRALLPVVKKIMMKDGPDNRRQILDSPAYQFYMRCIYPLEYMLGFFFKRFFAFRIVIVATR